MTTGIKMVFQTAGSSTTVKYSSTAHFPHKAAGKKNPNECKI